MLTTPIQLMLSGRTARAMRLRELPPASGEPANFLALWRVELAEARDGTKWYLVTNAETLLTFFLPRHSSQPSFESLAGEFKMRLRFAVLGATPPLDYNPAAVIPVKAAQIPKLVGSMNDMVRTAALTNCHLGSIDELSPEHEANFLNTTPFGGINMEYPRERFLAALATLPR